MDFGNDGTRTNAPATGAVDLTAQIPWNSGAGTSTMDMSFDPFTQYSTNSNILATTQDGKGVGNITSISIEKDGQLFANLDNGQTSIIGTMALVNFANPEGLTRLGGTLLQQSPDSGEPLTGTPQTGTFGEIQAGAIELSTVDIANEFVSLLTLQRGFQASARVITTLNQLVGEVFQIV
jgi:flagellar hook protein FlgE